MLILSLIRYQRVKYEPLKINIFDYLERYLAEVESNTLNSDMFNSLIYQHTIYEFLRKFRSMRQIFFEGVLPIFAIAMIGYFMGKRSIFDSTTATVINKVVFLVAVPALGFSFYFRSFTLPFKLSYCSSNYEIRYQRSYSNWISCILRKSYIICFSYCSHIIWRRSNTPNNWYYYVGHYCSFW